MRKKCLLALFTALQFSIGCKPIPNAGSATPTSVPSAVVMLTAAPRLMSLNQHCLDVSPTPEWGGTGALVLASRLLNTGSLIDMRDGNGLFLVENEYVSPRDFIQSPDRAWLAYMAINRVENIDILVIQSADGQKRFTYHVNYQEWNSIVYWLDNQTLVLWHYARPRTSIILFNPFTGEKTPMGFDYPNILSDDWEWQMFWPSITIYAPSLRYLAYLQESNGNLLDPRMVLWDRETQQPIATIKDFGYTLVRPMWKADESGLVYVKAMPGLEPVYEADEVYFLSMDGQNTQLTQLHDYFPEVKVWTYDLSPDERFLALNVQSLMPSQEWERRLLVLNLSSLELTDYCLKPKDFSSLIWSPDGQQLAFTEQLTDKQLRTVIVDMAEQRAFSVAEDLEPSAWLNIAK